VLSRGMARNSRERGLYVTVLGTKGQETICPSKLRTT
jgi:hypothetical protein